MKLALCLDDRPAVAERLATSMIDAQRHVGDGVVRRMPFAFGCLAVLGRPDESADALLAWSDPGGSFLAFAGLPLAYAERSVLLRADAPLVRDALTGADPARTLARLGAIDGSFVAVWWDAPRDTLAVVTDILGMQPLYRAGGEGATFFASEMQAFVQAGALPADPNAGAWGGMLAFGNPIGPRTLLRGAERVPAAQTSLFTAPTAESTRPTWAWPARTGDTNVPRVAEAAGDAVKAEVHAYATAYPASTILMSGGFDSRLILCLCRDEGLRPRLIVQSHPDENADADARFAEAFARTLGMASTRRSASPDFFSTDEYLRFLVRNEAATPSLYLFIANVARVIAAERGGVWDGVLVGPALKFDYGATGFGAYLEKRTGSRRAVVEASRLVFRDDWWKQMKAAYDADLAAERARFPDDAGGVWHFNFSNRIRYRTSVNPFQVYDTVTAPLAPGTSRRLWDIVAAADPAIRFEKRLYTAVFERLAPDGLRMPVASGADLFPGRGGAALYHTQRARAAAQRLAQRPRVARVLRGAGLPSPFAWKRSRFLDLALGEAALDDPRLNADWIRRVRTAGTADYADTLALETLFYWQAWRHVMRGDLFAAWGAGGA